MKRWFPIPRRDFKLKRIFVETTTRCNLRCIQCDHNPENFPGKFDYGDLSLETFRSILKIIRKYKPHVQLYGNGETLLHKDFIYMLERSSAAGASLSFQTNLTLLTPELAERIVAANVTIVGVSVDAAHEELFQSIRRGAVLKTVLDHIGLLNEAKQRQGRNTPEIYVNFVAMKRNIGELPELVGILGKLKVRTIYVLDLNEWKTMQGESVKHDPQFPRILKAAQEVAREYGVEIRSSLSTDLGSATPGSAPSPGGNEVYCIEPFKNLFIKYNGDVLPCCVIPDPYGNLNRQSFAEIWRGPKIKELRKRVLAHDFPPLCRKCLLARRGTICKEWTW